MGARARRRTRPAGHQRGADKIDDLLAWCDEAGVEVVTLWLLSTDNLAPARRRAGRRCSRIIEATVASLAAADRPWRVHPVGALDLLPDSTATGPEGRGRRRPADKPGLHVNVAVGYGGRREIADAVRACCRSTPPPGATIEEVADALDVDHIAEHLYTRGPAGPRPRSSGPAASSGCRGFLLWQSAHSEFYFCEAYWPDFRRVDFLRALRAYGQRERRHGT